MKKILLTGCSSGIGKVTTQLLLKRGYYVFGVDIVSSDIQDDHFMYIHADLTDFNIDDTWPINIDVIINSAGIAIYKNLENTNEIEMNKIYNINLFSAIKIINHYIFILRQNKGSIINIASVHSIVSSSGNAIYATSKYAIVGLTRNLALELGPEIRVNAISPGAIDTPMLRAGADESKMKIIRENTPLKRIGNPIDIAKAIQFLISDEASFITGVNLIVDGGATLRLCTG